MAVFDIDELIVPTTLRKVTALLDGLSARKKYSTFSFYEKFYPPLQENDFK